MRSPAGNNHGHSRTEEPDDGELGHAYGNQPGDHPPGLRCLAPGDWCHHRRVRPRHGLAYRGHSAASKEYRSRQQFIDEVLAPFGARFMVSEPFRPVTIRAVYADDVTDRPRAQVRRLGQLLLRQPRLGPQLPQQPGETQRSLLRHQPSIPSAQPRKPAPRLRTTRHRHQPSGTWTLGAAIAEPQHGTRTWTVTADPEGGEFCAFLRPEVPAERLHGLVADSADRQAQAGGEPGSTGSASSGTTAGSRWRACLACRSSPWTSFRCPRARIHVLRSDLS